MCNAFTLHFPVRNKSGKPPPVVFYSLYDHTISVDYVVKIVLFNLKYLAFPMGDIDIYVRDTLYKYSIPICFLLTLLIATFTDLLNAQKKSLFLKIVTPYMKLYHERTRSVRHYALFQDLDLKESNVISLRNRGVIRLLEIGVGAGVNLQYYPQQCQLVVVDPNEYFKEYFLENLDKFKDIHLEEYIVASAENFKQVPKASVDIVVTTTVLCSVRNLDKCLREIYRVLTPGGRFYFLEHVLDTTKSRRQRLQRFLTWSRIWPNVFGCRFVNMEASIRKVGFKQVDIHNFDIDHKGSRLLGIVAPHITGIATK